MKIIKELLELPLLVCRTYLHRVPKKHDSYERQMILLTSILSLVVKRTMASSYRTALVEKNETRLYFKVGILFFLA